MAAPAKRRRRRRRTRCPWTPAQATPGARRDEEEAAAVDFGGSAASATEARRWGTAARGERERVAVPIYSSIWPEAEDSRAPPRWLSYSGRDSVAAKWDRGM